MDEKQVLAKVLYVAVVNPPSSSQVLHPFLFYLLYPAAFLLFFLSFLLQQQQQQLVVVNHPDEDASLLSVLFAAYLDHCEAHLYLYPFLFSLTLCHNHL